MSIVCRSSFVADCVMDSLLEQQLWSNVLGHLAEDTVFYATRWDFEDTNVGSQGPIDSYLCLRCASVRLGGVVAGSPLLDALEYAISHSHNDDDCESINAFWTVGGSIKYILRCLLMVAALVSMRCCMARSCAWVTRYLWACSGASI